MRPGRFAMVVALLIAPLGRAEGSLVTETFGPFNFSAAATATVTNIPVTFPQFDPALGPLASLRFSFTESLSPTTVTFENRTASPITSLGSLPLILITVTADGINSTPFIPPPPPPIPLFPPIAAFDGTADFAGPDSLMTSIGKLNGTETRNFFGSPLSGFVGTGMITANLAVSFEYQFSANVAANPPAVQLSPPSTITGTFTVTYNAVPEPSSAVLLGTGSLVALALCVRSSAGTIRIERD
jgi:hypothetical protein